MEQVYNSIPVIVDKFTKQGYFIVYNKIYQQKNF